jgi:hypothetical protein
MTSRVVLFDAVLKSASIAIQNHAAEHLKHGDFVGLWCICINWYSRHDFKSHLLLLQKFWVFSMNKGERIRDYQTRKTREARDINNLERQGIDISPEQLLCVLLAGASARYSPNLESKQQEYELRAKDNPIIGQINCDAWFGEIVTIALRHEKDGTVERANAVSTKTSKVTNAKTGDCFAWMKTGKCRRDKDCSYNHPKSNKAKNNTGTNNDNKGKNGRASHNARNSSSTSSVSSSRPTTIICVYCRRPGHSEKSCFKKQNDEKALKINELQGKMSTLTKAGKTALNSIKEREATVSSNKGRVSQTHVTELDKEYTEVLSEFQRLESFRYTECKTCSCVECVCGLDDDSFTFTLPVVNNGDTGSSQSSDPKQAGDFDKHGCSSGVTTSNSLEKVSWLAASYASKCKTIA